MEDATAARLARVRAAHLAAASERDSLCGVCWEARRAVAFRCGHQACAACADRLDLCPSCRAPIDLRIRLFH